MNQTAMNLDHLLATGQATDVQIVEYLVHTYYPMLYRLGLHILRDHDDAEDAAQETIITASSKIGQYQVGTNMRAWVYTIGVNHCRAVLRWRQWQARLHGLLQQVRQVKADTAPSPELFALRTEADAQLWAAVNELNEKHRLPIILRYAHHLSLREVGEVLQLKEGTVRSRLYYAHKQLQARLKAQDKVNL
jgi:RNA polymerase sigma-70 factor (ECF subfamily)